MKPHVVTIQQITAAIAIASVTVLLQPFQFDISNNAFHIPIVLRWFDLPRFADDAFVQSLRQFATPVYPIISLFATETTISFIFFALWFAMRALTCYALINLAETLRAKDVWQQAACVSAACLAITAYRYSPVGADGVLLSYFSHTELAQAVALLSLVHMERLRLVKAGLLVGLTFAINVFVGVWLLAPLGLICLDHLLSGAGSPAARLRSVLVAAAAFTVPALPVVVWILRDQIHAAPVDFDYRAFLAGFYGFHFFIEASGWKEHLRLAVIVVAAALSLLSVRAGRRWWLILVGFVAVLLIGVVVGETASNRFILNLHLLRVDGMIVWLGLLLVATAIVPALWSRDLSRVAIAIISLIGLAAGRAGWLIVTAGVLLLMAPWRFPRLMAGRPFARPDPSDGGPGLPRLTVTAATAGALMVSAAWLTGGYQEKVAPDAPDTRPLEIAMWGTSPVIPDYLEVKSWVRRNTPEDAVILVSPELSDFRDDSRRSVWITRHDGAAVMWNPAFHAVWKKRLAETKAIESLPRMVEYACQNHLSYVVWFKKDVHDLPDGQSHGHALFENRWFVVMKADNCPA
jgi:hypothetical protein